MRIVTALLSLTLLACVAAPVCDQPELSREQILDAVKEQIRATGGSPGKVDDGTHRPSISYDGCTYIVRLAFPKPQTGTWATYSVTRDGQVRRVFRD